MPTNRVDRYRSTEVLTDDPVVVVRLLLEESMRTVRTAIEHAEAGRIRERGRAASKAVELLSALMEDIDTGKSPALGTSLGRLYDYCQHRVIEGHLRGEVRPFEDALSVLGDITGAWVEVLEREKLCPPVTEQGGVESAWA